MADGGLARSRGAHQGDQLPGSAAKQTSKSTWLGRCWSSTATDSSEASETSSAVGIAEVDVVELDGGRAAAGSRRASGFSSIIGRQVEHLEDPVEGDERGHDVDLDVRQRRERPVEPVQVGGEGDHGAHGSRAP